MWFIEQLCDILNKLQHVGQLKKKTIITSPYFLQRLLFASPAPKK